MSITGDLLIGSRSVRGSAAAFSAHNPCIDQPLQPAFSGAGEAEIVEACRLAAEAFDDYRETRPSRRADFLELIAEHILKLGDTLIERAMAETGLPRGRLEGERSRTVGQLRLFADLVRSGEWLEPHIDHAMPGRQPVPRPDLRRRQIPLGPVAVFGASNFPLAFSAAGGDTVSALAAGCPVVVKGHPAHPGTSELVGRAAQAAVRETGIHEGVFSLLQGAGNELGARLVQDPRVKAVGFTGSRSGGLALMRIAASRPEPIPVYAEMSSINPVILLPGALAARAEAIGRDFAASLVLGAGQFCTNPGLVLAINGPGLDEFLSAATLALSGSPAATMLTPGIYEAYKKSTDRLSRNGALLHVARGMAQSGPNQCQANLFVADANAFLMDASMQEETFGASSLVLRCADITTLRNGLKQLEGQLTATLQMELDDLPLARELLPLLEQKVGRVLVNGFPTGVEVCAAMVHGGPFPATSDARSTSVGTLAIRRFLRPVCYQGFPDDLLPDALQSANPLGLCRGMTT